MTDREHISRSEWRRVALFSATVMLLTSLPYAIGWLSAGGAWEFGGFLFGVDDGHSYLAKMRLGASGQWLFTNRYTSEPHQSALVFMPYLLLGKVTRLFISPDDPNFAAALAATFHAARVVLGFALLLVSYRFVATFLTQTATRGLAVILIGLAGGLGWLLALLGQGDWLGSLPVDFIVPEGYSFLILFGLPHLALARLAMLGGFVLLFRAWAAGNGLRTWGRWSLLAGLCWTVTGLCVPFYIPVVYLILVAASLAAWRRWRRLLWPVVWRAGVAASITLPLLAYTASAFLSNDVLRQWSSQNRLPSPHPVHYVLGYGVLALPAVIGIRWAWRRGGHTRGLPFLLILGWVIAAPLAVYLPVNVQRRLAEGVIVPLSILAVAGIRLAFPDQAGWRRARVVVLALVLPTSLLLWLGATFSALTPSRPAFHPREELAVMDVLNRTIPADSVILSLMETGNYLPVRTDLIAYIGHGPETIDSGRKDALARAFFDGSLSADAREALLREVDYVYFGPLEQAAAGTREPTWAASWRRLAALDGDGPVQVYEVPHD